MTEGLRAGDGSQHLLTFHPRGGDDVISTSSSVFANSDPVLDFNMQQNGHLIGTPTWARIAPDYSQLPTKPVIDGEPIYEDHPIGFKAAQFGYSNAYALFESRPFLTRIPDDSLIVPSSVPTAVPGAGTKFMNATRNSDGGYGIIYCANSRPYSVNLAQLSGQLHHFWWFNPRDGSNIDLGVFSRSKLIDVTPPFRGEDIDWIFVIDDVALDFPSPGFGQQQSLSDRGQLRFR